MPADLSAAPKHYQDPLIAEGQARRSAREFLQSLSHPEGSVAEARTLLGLERGFVYQQDVSEILSKLDGLQRMIAGLKHKLPGDWPLSSRLERHH